MKEFFGYIRVSTAKQGEHGVSLPEQRDAIEHYAAREGVRITKWFEERESAAKRGRPVFARMVQLLVKGKAAGIIAHKVDRSARNHSDWAELNELVDRGYDVRFAHEAIDLRSRGGRLVADVQAAVAMDYSRNLREEVKKGMYGRLKQGLYPLRAPLGYVDCGGGKPKQPDPIMAPLVRDAFELYASGQYSLETLREEMFRRGLRSRNGGRVGRSALSVLLNNPFYAGVIRIFRSGQTYAGVHPTLIPKVLFDHVHEILSGKTPHRVVAHDFPYRKIVQCRACGYSLIGEIQKGHSYYRCHSTSHLATCVREEVLEDALHRTSAPLPLHEREDAYARKRLALMAEDHVQARAAHAQALKLREERVAARLQKLTDALLDDLVEKDAFEERRAALLMERRQIEEDRAKNPPDPAAQADKVLRYLELGNAAVSLYETWLPSEKRDFLLSITSNRTALGKEVDFTLAEPFLSIAKRETVHSGGPFRDVHRTWDALLQRLWDWVVANPLSALPRVSFASVDTSNPATTWTARTGHQ